MGVPGMRCQQGRLRKDGSLTLSIPEAGRIRDLALEAGFARAGFVDPNALAGRGEPTRANADELEWSRVRPQEWKESASILVCCLSCHRPEPADLSTPDDPHGLIAPFARRNFYKTANRKMRLVLTRLEDELGIPRKTVRIFCNSRMPEKPLCVAAGLAWPGTNGLCIAPGLGSLFVIAGAVIPRAFPDASARAEPPVENHCGSCRRCIQACPTGAIVAPGCVDRSRCLQGMAADPCVLDSDVMEKWGTRLYGCQDCQSVCPHNRDLREETPAAVGEIGPSISLRWFLTLDSRRVAELFHGTAMGLSWISKEALVRNALVAAGNSRARALRECVAPFVKSASPVLSAAASWALERMTGA